MDKYDFSGWATRNNLRCSDGRIIRKDAFKENDGTVVPLVWNHQHNDPLNVLGHALLENRDEGVYAYCSLNNTEAGVSVKEQLRHGDITSLSIYANKLKQNGPDVIHGLIREVSLVLAGANPGAFIDTISFEHSEDGEDESEAYIFTGKKLTLSHAFEEDEEDEEEEEEFEESEEEEDDEDEEYEEDEDDDEEVAHSEGDDVAEKTVQDVLNELTEEQHDVVMALIDEALNHSDDEGEDYMKHNVFDGEQKDENVLSHAEMLDVINDGKKYGSMKDAFLAHGIEQVDWLFPEAKRLDSGAPEFIKRPDEWVDTVMKGVHHTPFSRIKSMFADITEDEARAKGYIKGRMKKEEVFGLLKRTTVPTTIYKKQKMDRDDVIDITDFDVIAWLKTEMRMMLDEEIARAILIGDGRPASSDDKINEQNIRPIYKDAGLFTVRKRVQIAANATDDEKADAVITAAVKARKDYRGSGNPVFFTTEDWLTDMILMKDLNKRRIYDGPDAVARAMRVSKIVTVPVMENLQDTDGRELIGIIVNLKDYNVGADKGGAVNMFDDFDIDYNAQKYLIETRCSGALIRPFSAIVLEKALDANDPSTDITSRDGVEVSH